MPLRLGWTSAVFEFSAEALLGSAEFSNMRIWRSSANGINVALLAGSAKC